MSMIVHGFPSKLAALQFEWAWQNPSVSRHLKEQDIPRTRTFKGNIACVFLNVLSCVMGGFMIIFVSEGWYGLCLLHTHIRRGHCM